MEIGDWIERWARLEPDRTALVLGDSGKRIAYGELHGRVLRAAGWLRETHAVGRGDRVAILAKNRPEHVELFFACARLGAVLVPVNWRLAAPEIGYILEDCGPKVVLHEDEFAPAAPEGSLALPASGSPWSDAAPCEGYRYGDLPEESPVMILYTSGTTGRPKGAVLTHRSIYWNSINTTLAWDLSGADSSLTHTPFFHTGGWNVLTTPLLHRGGKLVLTRGFDPDQALRILDDEELTIVFAVPTMFEMMIRSDAFAEVSFSKLRFMISGGAPCPEEVSQVFAERGVRFKQGYGLTEVGPNCFTVSLEDAAARPGTVGLPVHNEQVRLVDAEGRDVAPGEVGEILLRGPHMCAGYWNRPDATAEAIRDGWFWTGDLGRRDEDGFMYIVGRRKEMFISGGENVYPAEVERVLLMHEAVRQVAVVGMPHAKWGEVGRAFLVTESGEAVPVEELKQHCNSHLARYKVPKRWEFLEEMPLTPSGKIAKKALQDRAPE